MQPCGSGAEDTSACCCKCCLVFSSTGPSQSGSASVLQSLLEICQKVVFPLYAYGHTQGPIADI